MDGPNADGVGDEAAVGYVADLLPIRFHPIVLL